MKSAVIVLTALSLLAGSAVYTDDSVFAADNHIKESALISKLPDEQIPAVLTINMLTNSASLKTSSGEPIPGKEIWVVINHMEYSLTTDSAGNAALPPIADTGNVDIGGTFSGDSVYGNAAAEAVTATVPAGETIKKTGAVITDMPDASSSDIIGDNYDMNTAVSVDCSLAITGLQTILVDNRIIAASDSVAAGLKFSAIPASISGRAFQIHEGAKLETGSTILTMEPSYLQSLGSGKHILTFVYENNTIMQTIFYLSEEQNETKQESAAEQFVVTFLDCKGNTVKVEWVPYGGNATAPVGYGTYSGYTNVSAHMDLYPDSCEAKDSSYTVVNTADKN